MPTVTYSIDGFRQQLSDELKELRDTIKGIEEDEHFEDFDLLMSLRQSFDNLACLSNGFNCVSVSGFEGFSQMGHVEVELIDF